MTEPLVVFDNVSRHFGKFVAVDEINLQIQRGEFIALMGPSGCGKTTTLRMLAGLDKPDAGSIRLNGVEVNDLGPHKRETPMVWQSLALFPFMNVRRNVEFGLKMRGIDSQARKQKALDWLERLGMAEFAERQVSQLSGGQKQRVALARALVTEPEILLLDEPLSALDAHLVVRMQGVLKQLHSELGITFVYVTHSQSEAFAMADRVAILSKGQIAQIGAPREVYRQPADRFVAEFVGRNNILSGSVSQVAEDQITVDTAIGQFALTGGAQRAGDECAFVISADLVQICVDEPQAPNRVCCRLISEQFVGSFVTLFLEADDGTEFRVEVQQREIEKLDLSYGAKLWLYWNSEHAHLLPA